MNPALAFGALLAVIPLIIHLLNRRRHKPLRWGAMRFVEAAYKRTRRRMQMENLLLLLLRMGAVAALAFAVARPFANRGALGALTESSRDVVLLLDASASTGYREDIDTVFDRIVRRAQAIVDDLEPDRGDRVHVLMLGNEARLIAWPTPEKAASVLGALDSPLDEPLDLVAAFGELERLVSEGEILDMANTEVRFLTDLQRSSFSTQNEDGSLPAYFDTLDSLESQGMKIAVEDLGPASSTPPNLSVDSVVLEGPAQGHKEVTVTVFNQSNLPQPAVRVSLELDGNRMPSQRVDLAPRSMAQAQFSLGILESGAHSLVASTEGDRLAIDDHRAEVTLVPDPTRVLLVNGAPAEEIESDGVGYLRLALEQDPSGDAPSPFVVREIRPGGLNAPDLDITEFDVIWLAATPAPKPAVIEALENHVLEGAALVISAGPGQGDLSAINERMFRADGSGLLPGEFLRRVSIARRGDFYRIESFEETHPALAVFSDSRLRPLLIGVPFSDFILMAPDKGSKVLASLDDQAKSPLLVEKMIGRGRVLVWTSSINEDWTLLPRAGRTFVPLVYEWLTYAAGSQTTSRSIRPGETMALEVQGFPRAPELERPDGSRRPIDGDPVAVGGNAYRLPPIPGNDTRQVGLYQVHIDGGASQPFASVLDPKESDLTRLTGAELQNLHSSFLLQAPSSKTNSAGSSRDTGEIWRFLAALALACLIGESLWGAYIGRRRMA